MVAEQRPRYGILWWETQFVLIAQTASPSISFRGWIISRVGIVGKRGPEIVVRR